MIPFNLIPIVLVLIYYFITLVLIGCFTTIVNSTIFSTYVYPFLILVASVYVTWRYTYQQYKKDNTIRLLSELITESKKYEYPNLVKNEYKNYYNNLEQIKNNYEFLLRSNNDFKYIKDYYKTIYDTYIIWNKKHVVNEWYNEIIKEKNIGDVFYRLQKTTNPDLFDVSISINRVIYNRIGHIDINDLKDIQIDSKNDNSYDEINKYLNNVIRVLTDIKNTYGLIIENKIEHKWLFVIIEDLTNFYWIKSLPLIQGCIINICSINNIYLDYEKEVHDNNINYHKILESGRNEFIDKLRQHRIKEQKRLSFF